jgi:tetratricopeptide (TPR) repeat protein
LFSFCKKVSNFFYGVPIQGLDSKHINKEQCMAGGNGTMEVRGGGRGAVEVFAGRRPLDAAMEDATRVGAEISGGRRSLVEGSAVTVDGSPIATGDLLTGLTSGSVVLGVDAYVPDTTSAAEEMFAATWEPAATSPFASVVEAWRGLVDTVRSIPSMVKGLVDGSLQIEAPELAGAGAGPVDAIGVGALTMFRKGEDAGTGGSLGAPISARGPVVAFDQQYDITNMNDTNRRTILSHVMGGLKGRNVDQRLRSPELKNAELEALIELQVAEIRVRLAIGSFLSLVEVDKVEADVPASLEMYPGAFGVAVERLAKMLTLWSRNGFSNQAKKLIQQLGSESVGPLRVGELLEDALLDLGENREETAKLSEDAVVMAVARNAIDDAKHAFFLAGNNVRAAKAAEKQADIFFKAGNLVLAAKTYREAAAFYAKVDFYPMAAELLFRAQRLAPTHDPVIQGQMKKAFATVVKPYVEKALEDTLKGMSRAAANLVVDMAVELVVYPALQDDLLNERMPLAPKVLETRLADMILLQYFTASIHRLKKLWAGSR